MKTDPDPHGQAAMMLCEGLLLLLIEQKVVTKEQATQAVDEIIDIKQAIAGETESVVVSLALIGLLQAVSQSMSASSDPKPLP